MPRLGSRARRAGRSTHSEYVRLPVLSDDDPFPAQVPWELLHSRTADVDASRSISPRRRAIAITAGLAVDIAWPDRPD